ncbi:hypothetical protein [Gilvimarinus chinensis]|uniref:hypothetical protein n=1 Tax=Gilvimarinus chinensis TaxID=396005 RepID=UPI00037A6B07|nr:hypothetical protein [Gilvimarinus chinensis]
MKDKAKLEFWHLPEARSVCSVGVGITVIWSAFLLDGSRDLLALGCYEGANKFLFEILKAPLRVLAGTVALLALIAVNHRSVQSAAAIELQGSQNALRNYLDHLKEFREYAQEKQKSLKKVSVDVDQAYRYFYPKSNSQAPLLSGVHLHNFIRDVYLLCDLIYEARRMTSRERRKQWDIICQKIEIKLSDMEMHAGGMGLRLLGSFLGTVNAGDSCLEDFFNDTDDRVTKVLNITYILEFVDVVFAFDPHAEVVDIRPLKRKYHTTLCMLGLNYNKNYGVPGSENGDKYE